LKDGAFRRRPEGSLRGKEGFRSGSGEIRLLEMAAEEVEDQEVGLLDPRGLLGGNGHPEVRGFRAGPPAPAGQDRGEEAALPRLLEGTQDVRGSSRGRDADAEIAGPAERADLAGEDLLVTRVVGDRRQRGDLMTEGDRGERAPILVLEPAYEFAGRMGRIAGRPPVSAEKEPPPGSKTFLRAAAEFPHGRQALGEQALFRRDALPDLVLEPKVLHARIKAAAGRGRNSDRSSDGKPRGKARRTERPAPPAKDLRTGLVRILALLLLPPFLVPGSLSAQDFYETLARRVALIARCRWPWPPIRGLCWAARPEDADPDSLALSVGGILYDRGLDVPIPMPEGLRARLPLDGFRPEGAGKGTLQGTVPLGNLESPVVLEGFRNGTASRRIRLRLSNPSDLLFPGEAHDAKARRALLWRVLAPPFRRGSALLAKDPGPGLRGREHWKDRRTPRKAPPPRSFRTRDLAGLPLLGFLVRTKEGWKETRLQKRGYPGRLDKELRKEAAAFEALLAAFLDGLRWPLPVAEGMRPVFLPDDLLDRHGMGEHPGLDLGGLYLDGRNRPHVLRDGVPLRPPHVRARPWRRPRDDGEAWVVECRRGPHLLRVLMALYHLRDENPPRLDEGPIHDSTGSWFRASDPWRRMQGVPKGPHLHLEILGLFPTSREMEACFLADPVPRRLLQAAERNTPAVPPSAFRPVPGRRNLSASVVPDPGLSYRLARVALERLRNLSGSGIPRRPDWFRDLRSRPSDRGGPLPPPPMLRLLEARIGRLEALLEAR